MASAAECLAAIDEAAGGQLDDATLEQLIEDLARVRDKQRAQGGLESVEEALFKRAGEIAEDVELTAAIEKRNRLINIVKEAQLLDLIQRADDATGDPSLGLEAATVGINAPIEGGRASVDAQAHGIRNTTMGGVVHDLKKAGLHQIFTTRQLDREIARELWDLSLESPTGKATDSQNAKAIAQILHKYRRALVMQENRAGSYIRFKQGYVVRQSHNRNRMMRSGQKAWADFLRDRLDWDAMDVPVERREDFLKSAFGSLVTGERKDVGVENDLMFAFKGPGNLAKKDSQSRVMLFKSSDDWSDYNDRFGMGSLNEAYIGDVSRAANSIALMNVFGTNPRAMFDKVRSATAERLKTTDPDKSKRMQRRALDWYMDEVDGTANIPANYSMATVGRAIRAIESAAKLGGAVISAITDLAFAASERRYQGRTLLQSFNDSFMAPVRGFTNSQTREYGDLLGTGINGITGDVLQRFSAQDDVPGKISKAMGLFFKLNLLTPWTDGVQRGIGVMMARDLAMNANKALGALDPKMQRMLGQFGFDERKWEIARQAMVDADGTQLILPGAVDDVSGAVFTGLSQRQQQALKDEVRVALAALINDRVNFASPTPGARERALTKVGTEPGTPAGEAWRFLMQFKSFPITVISKVQGRDLMANGANRAFRDGLLRGEGDILGLATTIAHGTILGYVALQAKELLKGREIREDVGFEMVTASMMQGGGLGIYGDFLLGEANRFGGSPIDTVAGPTFGAILGKGGVVDLFQRGLHGTAGGEPPDLWASILKLGKSNTPGANLFYTKAALDYLIFYQLQEAANPGYLRRVERRMKRENNQSFMIPPSKVIPYGGGSRIFEGVR